MIQQTSGEFEEKFKARDLEEVMNLPNEEVVIRADGRRMWRVLSNIYNNGATLLKTAQHKEKYTQSASNMI